VVTSLGLADTVFSVVDEQFGEVDRRDLTVTLDAPVTASDLATLRERGDIAAAERFAEAPVTLAADGDQTDQLLQVFEAETVAHGFDGPLPGEGLVVGSSARVALDLEVGDAVEVVVPGAGQGEPSRITTTVAGFVDEPVPSVSYASVDAWERAGAEPTSTVVVTLVDRSQHEEVRDELQAEPNVLAVVDQQASVQALQSLMGLTYVFIGLMVAFALVMAVALVYNMVSVSLAERTGEVATLQANGVERSFIRRTVTGENLLTILAGVIPGLLVGFVMARAFLGQFETESFTFDLVLLPRSILLAVGLVVVSGLLAQWPGLRSLDRLDLASVVRERSE
jgi:putative ABC transport system permease protein